MLGYKNCYDGFDRAMVTAGWLVIVGTMFGIYLLYAGFTTIYARDGQLVGQAKKVTLVTPFWHSFCPTYYALDVSMGVLQNGTGSMSAQDMWLTIVDINDLPAMQKAVETAALVKVKYDTRRLAACTEDYYATGFEVVR